MDTNIPDYWVKVKRQRRKKAKIKSLKEKRWQALLNKDIVTINKHNNSKRQIKRKSIKRELTIAIDTGGKRHMGSGSLWYKKSDASDSDFQYEDKFTNNLDYRITLSDLKKIEREALLSGKLPVFKIGYLNTNFEIVILRRQDCILNDTIYYKINTNNKSILLKSDDLNSYYIQFNGGIFLIISFSNNTFYIIITWKYFLEIKDSIVQGEKI